MSKTIGRENYIENTYNIYYTSRGMESLRLILASLPRNLVYAIPNFNCPEVTELFMLYCEDRLIVYDIHDDLTIDYKSIKGKYDALYAVNYFGIQQDYDKAFDKIIIEDNVFNTGFDVKTHKYIGFNSFRKISPLREGSIIKTNMLLFPDLSTKEDMLIDYLATKYYSKQAENNYFKLDELLSKYRIGSYPMQHTYYPIAINNRDDVQDNLFNYDIYLPVFWRGCTNYLSERIICIPVDDRYMEIDMLSVAKMLLGYIA